MASVALATLKPKFPDRQPCKVVVIGDVSVGKSALVRMFGTQKPSRHRTYSTIGVDFVSMKRKYPPFETVHLHDTAGEERFRAVVSQFYRNVNAALLVYDVTRAETFEHATGYWVRQLREINPRATIALMGTKEDLVRDGHQPLAVTAEQALDAARTVGATFTCQGDTITDKGAEALFRGWHALLEEVNTTRQSLMANGSAQPKLDLNTVDLSEAAAAGDGISQVQTPADACVC